MPAPDLARLSSEGRAFLFCFCAREHRSCSALKARAGSDELVSGGSKRGRVNLLAWDGKGMPEGLFPPEGTNE